MIRICMKVEVLDQRLMVISTRFLYSLIIRSGLSLIRFFNSSMGLAGGLSLALSLCFEGLVASTIPASS